MNFNTSQCEITLEKLNDHNKNLEWLVDYGIFSISDINPNNHPIDLPLEILQDEMFTKKKISRKYYSPEIVNNLSKLWYIYCAYTFPDKINVDCHKTQENIITIDFISNPPKLTRSNITDAI